MAQRDEDAPRAEAAYREAIRLEPNYVQGRANLANLLSKQNRTEEAAYEFEAALRLEPDYALGHLNYGMMLAKKGDLAKARQQLAAAGRSSDPAIRQKASQRLSEIGR